MIATALSVICANYYSIVEARCAVACSQAQFQFDYSAELSLVLSLIIPPPAHPPPQIVVMIQIEINHSWLFHRLWMVGWCFGGLLSLVC